MKSYTNTKTGQVYRPTIKKTPYTTKSGDKIELRTWLSNCAHCGEEFAFLISDRHGENDATLARRNCDKHKGKMTPEGRKALSVARKAYLRTPEGQVAEYKRREAARVGRAAWRKTPEGIAATKKWADACTAGRERNRLERARAAGLVYDADGYPAPYTKKQYLACFDPSHGVNGYNPKELALLVAIAKLEGASVFPKRQSRRDALLMLGMEAETPSEEAINREAEEMLKLGYGEVLDELRA